MSDRDDKRDQRGRDPYGDDIDPDAPPSDEEVAASTSLRNALDGQSADSSIEDVDLVRSLRAAWAPEPIDLRAHASIIDDMPTEEELAPAAELRAALSKAREIQPEIVVALRSAWSPTPIEGEEHRAIVEHALARPVGGDVLPLERSKLRPRTMRMVVVTTTSVLALAASIGIWMNSSARGQEAPLAKSRSTEPLFGAPFKAGEASARIDRIAIGRASEYRDNRFVQWGVR